MQSPDPIETSISGRNRATEEQIEGMKGYMAGITSIKRFRTSEEIAEGFLHLTSGDLEFIVGFDLVLDRGFLTI